MAPISQKRRREEDGVRKPKKKVHVKRQKYYHSDSEDEDEDQPVVSDAPVKRAGEGKSKLVKTLTGSHQHPVEKRVKGKKQQPKSILKQARKASPQVEDAAASGSEDEGEEEDDEGVDVDETELNTALNAAPAEEGEESVADSDIDLGDQEEPIAQDAPSTEESDLDASASDSDTSLTSSNLTGPNKVKRKRNDPSAFATSITRILDTKLTTSKRADPVLSRSATAATANKALLDGKLETAARNQLKTEKRAKLEKGRVRDVLGLSTAEVSTGEVQEEEKRLKKVAQRGVVRLFNAVRAAQVRAEQGEELVRAEGTVGMGKREERVGGMSKEGFLELISRGGGEKAGA